MEAIVHYHPADLSGRVQRWRAAPETLPAIIRAHHAATPVERPSRALLIILGGYIVAVIALIVLGALMAGHKL